MKYINCLIDNVFELNDKVNVIVIENKKFFRIIIEDLLNQSKLIHGNSKFINTEDEINFSNNCEIIHDFFTLDFESKRIKTRILSEVKEVVKNEINYLKIKDLESKIKKVLLEVFNQVDFNLDFLEEVDFTKLIKSIELGIIDDSETFLEKLINYIEMHFRLFNTNIFIFVNLLQFLSENERKDFYYHCKIKNIKILLFENMEQNVKMIEEKYYIIDEDLCCIY